VNRLAGAIETLAKTVDAKGGLVATKVDFASERITKSADMLSDNLLESGKELTSAMEKVSAAAEKHARSLSKATWWLAIATGALVLVAVGHIFVALTAAAH
jgi:hypothetical protein